MMRRVDLPGIGTVEVYPRPNHQSIALEIGARTPGVRLVSLEVMPEHILELAHALEMVALDALAAESRHLAHDDCDHGCVIGDPACPRWPRRAAVVELPPDPLIVARALSESEARLMDGNR